MKFFRVKRCLKLHNWIIHETMETRDEFEDFQNRSGKTSPRTPSSFLNEVAGYGSPVSGIDTFRKRMANMKLKGNESEQVPSSNEKQVTGVGNASLLRNSDHLVKTTKRVSPTTPRSPRNDTNEVTMTTKALRSRPASLRHHRPLMRYNSNPEPDIRGPKGVTSPPGTSDHHRRSQSCRRPQVVRPHELNLLVDDDIRPRTVSMPSKGDIPKPQSVPARAAVSQGQTPGDGSDHIELNFYRVRSFTSTSRGIINRGDSFKRRKRMTASNLSIDSTGSCPERLTQLRRTWSTQSQGSRGSSVNSSLDADTPTSFRVIILGAPGVGKTAIIQQFMTSEYMGNVDPCLSKFIHISHINYCA